MTRGCLQYILTLGPQMQSSVWRSLGQTMKGLTVLQSFEGGGKINATCLGCSTSWWIDKTSCVVPLLIYLFAFSTYLCTAPAYIYLCCLWASSAYLCRVLTYLCAVLAYAWLWSVNLTDKICFSSAPPCSTDWLNCCVFQSGCLHRSSSQPIAALQNCVSQ